MTLLSAAEVYGVSPYPTTVTQVMVPAQRRPITVGRQRIVFHTRANITPLPTRWHETADGRFLISTPELTMLDGHRYGSEDKMQSGQVEPNDEIPSSHMGRALEKEAKEQYSRFCRSWRLSCCLVSPKGWTLDSRTLEILQRLDRLFAVSRFGTPLPISIGHSNRSRTGRSRWLLRRTGWAAIGGIKRMDWAFAPSTSGGLRRSQRSNVTKDQLKELSQTRTGAFVSVACAEKYGWKIGDRISVTTNTSAKGWVQNLDLRCIGGFLSRRARR